MKHERINDRNGSELAWAATRPILRETWLYRVTSKWTLPWISDRLACVSAAGSGGLYEAVARSCQTRRGNHQ